MGRRYFNNLVQPALRRGGRSAFKLNGPGQSVTPTISVTPSITPTISVTPSVIPSVTPSISISATPSVTSTPTISITPSITPTISVTPTPTISITPTPTISITPSVTPSISISATPSVTPTPTISITPSITPTISVTPSITPTISVTPSVTPSISISATPSVTPTPTISITPSITPTISVTPTPTISITPTPTISVTPSVTPTISITPSITPTISVTPTPTISITPSITPTISVTPSVTPSITPPSVGSNFEFINNDFFEISPPTTPSITPSTTPMSSVTPSTTPMSSVTPSTTPMSSVTPSTTPMSSVTPSNTPSNTPSISPSVTPSTSVGAVISFTNSHINESIPIVDSVISFTNSHINESIPIVDSVISFTNSHINESIPPSSQIPITEQSLCLANVAVSARTASETYENNVIYSWASSELHPPVTWNGDPATGRAGWVVEADDNLGYSAPWLQLNLNNPDNVAGVVTQGYAFGSAWVTSFMFQHLSGSNWVDVDNGDVFIGNVDGNTKKQITFASPVNTTSIRIFPQTKYITDDVNNLFTLRADLCLDEICPEPEPEIWPPLDETPEPMEIPDEFIEEPPPPVVVIEGPPPPRGGGDPHLIISAPDWATDANGNTGVDLINFTIDDNISGNNLMFFGCIVNGQEHSMQYGCVELPAITGGWSINNFTIKNGLSTTTTSISNGTMYINGVSAESGTSFYNIDVMDITVNHVSGSDNFNYEFDINWEWIWTNQTIIDNIGGAWWYVNRRINELLAPQSIPTVGLVGPAILESGPTGPNIDGIGLFLSGFDISPPITSRSYFETSTLSSVSDVFSINEFRNVIISLAWLNRRMLDIPALTVDRFDWDPLMTPPSPTPTPTPSPTYVFINPNISDIDDPFGLSIQ